MPDAANPANRVHSLLTPQNCTVIFIGHQPQMTFGVMSIDRQLLFNNVIGLAKAARIFKVPVILTTVETKGFSGYMWPDLLEQFPGQEPIERTSMNSWEDKKFVAAVEKTGRKKVVITRTVRQGSEHAFEAAVKAWVPKALAFPGHLGVHMLHPPPGGTEYGAVLKFRSQTDWAAFQGWPEYLHFLTEIRKYLAAEP